jgi:hypothetical protein
LSWVGDAPVEQILSSIDKVSDIAIRASEGLFRFAGSDDELAALLHRLVTHGLRILSFGEVKQTIEDLYLKLSRNEVM